MAPASSCKQRVSADKRLIRDDELILIYPAPMTIPAQPVMAMDGQGFDPQLLALIPRLAHRLGYPRVALVGGAVRDGLLSQQLGTRVGVQRDLDFVVEGDALPLAEALQKTCGETRVPWLRSHAAYQTVAMEVDGLSVDFASARRETYPAPAENPVVERGSLELDLTRRDFTINAMALVLKEQTNAFELVDPFQGSQHLVNAELVFLHGDSVRDDPTRVVRAARYASRFGFVLRSDARDQVLITMREWPWGWRCGDDPAAAPPALSTRLRMELELLFEKEPWPQALRHLEDWGAYPLLDAGLQLDPQRMFRLRWAQRLGLPLLPALLLGADQPQAVGERLQLPLLQQRWLGQVEELVAWLESPFSEAPQSSWSPVDWTMGLEAKGWCAEAVGLVVATGHRYWRPLLRWCGRWRHLRAVESAQELLDQGWTPGPALGAELRRRRMARLAVTR